jgi:hypothetical protein
MTLDERVSLLERALAHLLIGLGGSSRGRSKRLDMLAEGVPVRIVIDDGRVTFCRKERASSR